jgi:hypothetical protein
LSGVPGAGLDEDLMATAGFTRKGAAARGAAMPLSVMRGGAPSELGGAGGRGSGAAAVGADGLVTDACAAVGAMGALGALDGARRASSSPPAMPTIPMSTPPIARRRARGAGRAREAEPQAA